MRRLFIVLALVSLLVLPAGCSRDDVIAPFGDAASGRGDLDPRIFAGTIIEKSGWPIETEEEVPVGCAPVTLVNRQPILGSIVHYSYTLRIGPGPYDVIGLHRVVKETRPYKPIRTNKAIFLQHGDAIGFVKFLYGVAAPSAPDERSFAVYLAANDVDVWGIDQDWVLVPADVPDFTFMRDWGMQHCIDNLRIGLGVARAARVLTGCGPDGLLLLGYSSGGILGYAYLNEETQLPPRNRLVDGYVCVDVGAPLNDEINRPGWCIYAEYYRGLHESGEYAEPIPFPLFADLAKTDPDGPSPLAPTLTNLQVAVIFAAAPWLFDPTLPTYHYAAGVFDESGMPVDLQFMTIDNWLDFMAIGCPWEPRKFMVDYSDLMCGEADLPFDDHYDRITVPICYIGAMGGFGDLGLYTLELLGSTDISTTIAQLYPTDQRHLDFAHCDIFAAGNAQELLWTPVLDWIVAHSRAHPGKGNIAGKH